MNFNLLKSGVPGLRWPVVVNPDSSLAMALQFQLEQSQWLPYEELQALQLKQAEALIYHAAKTVPLYKARIPKGLIGKEITYKDWVNIPILTRQDLLEAGDKQKSIRPLPGHDQLSEIKSSGSTGMAITAYATQTTGLFWQAFTLREHLWQKRDFSLKLAAIRPLDLEPGQASASDSWGGVTGALFKTGKAVAISSRTSIKDQLIWLQKEDPDYLLSLPSNIRELARAAGVQNIKLPRLKEIRTMGEILTDETVQLCADVWGVSVVDMYSAQEIGYIAIRCPDFDGYHIQSEGVLVEILDDNEKPCKPGEIGRVVVTTLLNLGAPLIRYALGDYAEVGEVCQCGRGLPVIKKVLGRQRNMLKTPDGRTFFPSFPEKYWAKKIKQLQFVQTELDSLVLRLISSEPLSSDEESELIKVFNHRADYDYKFTFEYCDEIPRSKGGKYEDFISLI